MQFLIVLRKFASKLIEQKIEQQEQEEQISQKVQQMQKEKIGWGLFMSSSRKAQEQKEIEEFKNKLQQDLQAKLTDQKNQLDSELNSLTEELSKTQLLTTEDFDKMPHGYIRFRLSLGVPSLCLSFVNEFDQTLFISEIEGQSAKLDVGKGLTRAKFSVSSFNIKDQWTGAKAFPNILETIEFESERFKEQKDPRQALVVSFETNDQMVICPFRVVIDTQKTIFLVANLPFIKELQRSSLRALNGESLDFSFFRDAATQKALQYMSQGKEFIESLKSGEYQHQSFDVSLFMQAPVILIPENIFQPSRPCIVVDAGSVSLENELVGYTQGIDYKAIKSPSSLYDKYEITLQNFQINVLENGLPGGLSTFVRGSGQAAIKQFTAKVTAFVCVDPMHSLFPSFELDVVIKHFEVCLSVRFVEGVLRIKNAVLDQLENADEQVFADTLKKGQQVPIVSAIGEQIKQKLQEKQKEGQRLELEGKASQGEKEGEDVFFDMMEEAVDEQKLLEREESIKAQAKKDQSQGMATCMKAYFSIEKFHILLQQDVKSSQQSSKEDVLSISILQLGLEADIDRQKNLLLNLSIYKFIIQDVQDEIKIAPQFRMILSSPLVDQHVEAIAVGSPTKGAIFRDTHELDFFNAGVTQRSLISIIGPVHHKFNLEDEEEFKEAVSSEEERKQTYINELDVSVSIVGQNVIDVKCVLQDMRFVFAVPTAQKLAFAGIGLQKLLKEAEDDHENSKRERIQFYREVIQQLQEGMLGREEICLWQKIFTNTSNQFEVEETIRTGLYLKALQKLQITLEQPKSQIPIAQIPIQQECNINKDKTQTEKLKEVMQKISVKASLRNFSVWIPLQAQSVDSQIFNLSFMADMGFNQEQLQVGLNKEKLSQDNMDFSLNHLTISMINLKDYSERQDSFKSKTALMGNETHAVSEFINHSTISTLLDPCRIQVKISNESNLQKLRSTSDISVNLESLRNNKGMSELDSLSIKIGFKHVDFANVIMAQLQQTLDYIKKLQDNMPQEHSIDDQRIETPPVPLKKPSFQRYNPQQIFEYKTSSIKVICNSISLALNDDTDIRADKPLFSAVISNLQLSMKSNESEDDAGTFILKKLGLWNRKNYKLIKVHLFKDIHAVADLQMNYYNHRSQAYEPLLEPWFIQFGMTQLSPSTRQHINIESKKMLNINMTFGMALTVKKIKDRLMDSLKQAEIMSKLEQGLQVNEKEDESHKIWRRQLLGSQKSQRISSELDTQDLNGFLFENHTGVPISFAVHDPSNLAYDDATLKNISASWINENEWRLSETNSPTFLSQSVLYKLHQEIKRQKNSGITVECLEDDPLMFDLKMEGVQLISNIQVEGLGVYSYRGYLNHKSQFALGAGHPMQSQGSLFGGILGDDRKPEDLLQKIGVVVNITLEGNQKKISIESQVVIANNHPNPMVIYAKADHDSTFVFQIEIQPGQVYRVPLTWIYGANAQSLYVQTQKGKQLIFKNLQQVFSHTSSGSILNSKQYSVVEITSTFFTSVDVIGYKCLPKSLDNAQPPQYVISFNPPIWLSNYNFQPLEMRDSTNKVTFAKIAPKETAQISTLDFVNRKQDISWLAYEASLQGYMYLGTANFDLLRRFEGKPYAEEFNFITKQPQYSHQQYLTFEVKKMLNQGMRAYDGESFELRERLIEATSSFQIMVYPKCMVVNKTLFPLHIDKQFIKPLTNEYLGTSSSVIRVKTPGYSSEEIDASTIGISGALSLELESKDEVQLDKLPTREYIPQKLELGVIIQQAQAPFNKTTLVTIVPRYVILNKLGSPIIIKQKNQGGFHSGMKQILMHGEQEVFNFQSKKDRFVMLRQLHAEEQERIIKGGKMFEDLAAQENFWSSPFSVDDIEDFQVSYPANSVQQINGQSQWYLPSHENGLQRFVRVIITTQNDASILIVITNPVYPEYEISNKSDALVEIAQLQDSSILQGFTRTFQSQNDQIIGKFQRIPPRAQASYPFAWQNRMFEKRKIAVKIDGVLQDVNVDKALERTEFFVPDRQSGIPKKYQIEIQISGNAKTIVINNVGKEQNLKIPGLYLQTLLKKRLGQKLWLAVDIKGLQLSFVDEAPQELLLLTLYELKVRHQQWTESRDDKGSGQFEKSTKFKFQMQHLQIDNMSSQVMPVILAPSKPFLNKLDFTEKSELLTAKKSLLSQSSSNLEESKEQDSQKDEAIGNPPFLQFIINVSESTQQDGDKIPVMRVRALQFAIQEFQFQIDTSIIESNLKFIIELLQTFSADERLDYLQARQDSYEISKSVRREQICEQLNPSNGLISDPQDIHGKKIFIELIHLGAIKANLTFRLEKQAVEIDITDPGRGFGFLNIFYTLISGVASISNSPLTFKELVMTDVFASQEMLVSQISKNYIYQAMSQFYKLIGSSDLIGNPVGLIGKLGTGVYELVSEPAKGLLRGPDEFVGGVGKGIQSVVGNVVQGGFESLSKISGSLYTVVKNVGGDKDAKIEKSEHIGQGIMHGIKGAGGELVGGLTGIFTKPLEKSKQEGAKGFFKGLGSGLFGAISAPVTATLKAGSSITQGVAATATSIGNIGKAPEHVKMDASLIYSRFRPPRYINHKNVLIEFDMDLSLIHQILSQVKNGKYAVNSTIKYFATLQETSARGELENRDPNSSILILTDTMLLYLRIDREGPSRGKPTFSKPLQHPLNSYQYIQDKEIPPSNLMN